MSSSEEAVRLKGHCTAASLNACVSHMQRMLQLQDAFYTKHVGGECLPASTLAATVIRSMGTPLLAAAAADWASNDILRAEA